MSKLILIGSVVLPALIAIAVIVFMVYKIRYKTVKGNEAMIITGPNLGANDDKTIFYDEKNGRKFKVVFGGGYLLKMHQTQHKVPFRALQIPITTPPVRTSGHVPIIAKAYATVNILNDLAGFSRYVEHFLGADDAHIEESLGNILGTSLREIISKSTVEQVNNDREQLISDVKDIAQEALSRLGFDLSHFGIEDIEDAPGSDYLKNLSRAQTAVVRKQADMAESEAQKETRIARAANEEAAKKEEVRSGMSVIESEKERDLKAASIKEETERARAKAELAYGLEKAKYDQLLKTEEMKVVLIEKERSLELESKDKDRRIIQAEANAIEIEKLAEAQAVKERIERENRATIALVEAEKAAKAQELEAKAKANAEKEAGLAAAQVEREKGLAQAEVVKHTGLAEAEMIKARGIAEAEAKELMAEAMAKFGEAAVIEMLLKVMPELARELAAPLANVGEIKIIDMGNGEGVNNLSKGVINNMTTIQHVLGETSGIDVKELLSKYLTTNNESK